MLICAICGNQIINSKGKYNCLYADGSCSNNRKVKHNMEWAERVQKFISAKCWINPTRACDGRANERVHIHRFFDGNKTPL